MNRDKFNSLTRNSAGDIVELAQIIGQLSDAQIELLTNTDYIEYHLELDHYIAWIAPLLEVNE